MAKGKRGTKDNPATLQDVAFANENKKDYVIKEASIHDDFCHYKFLILKGTGEGRTLSSTNQSNVIKDKLRNAFSKLNVHLACIDDVFKNNSIEIEDIDLFHNHELTDFYRVQGFKVKGGEGNESVILLGTKHVSAAGSRISIETPRIPLDSLSSYKWYNELKDAFTEARKQVEAYHEGEYEVLEEEEVVIKTNPRQKTIGEAIDEAINSQGQDDEDENPDLSESRLSDLADFSTAQI